MAYLSIDQLKTIGFKALGKNVKITILKNTKKHGISDCEKV